MPWYRGGGIWQVFVAGEDTAVFETGTDLIEALVDLIAAYYVFDACKLSWEHVGNAFISPGRRIKAEGHRF